MTCCPPETNKQMPANTLEVAGKWPCSGGLGCGVMPGRPRPTARRRESGSALILSIVTIVMLVMLGAAYLQVARTDRRTAAAVDTRSNQNDGSILRYIGGILAVDLPEGYDGTGPEPYDVAWSNNATAWTVPDVYAPTVVPGPVPNLGNSDQPAREPRANTALADAAGLFQARGGELDDPWLAAIEPFFTGTAGATPYWSHITNLSGVFLDLGNIAAGNDTVPGGTRPMPAQYLATAAGTSGWTPTGNQLRSDVAFTVPAIPMALIPLADRGLFADADRDNIADSRWTWAPLPYEGGQAAIMAVRIVDNSALLNVNALSYRRNNAGGEPPRWLWPGELDLHTGIEGIVTRSNGGTLATNSLNILTNGAPTGRNMGDETFENRLDNWLYTTNNNRTGWERIGSKIEQDAMGVDGVEEPNDPGRTYSSYGSRQEEIEFRYRNGLNNDLVVTSFESLDNAMFRSGATETVYSDSPYGGPTATEGDIGPYFIDEPRKWITTVSGSSAFGQENLNEATTQELSLILNTDYPDKRRNIPAPNSRLTDYGGWVNMGEYTDQLACILKDFRDEDSELTELNGMYGMEYLPFVSEVYLQSRYANTLMVPDTVSTLGYDVVTWSITNTIASTGPGISPTTDTFAIAIEIVNPWPWTIEIPDVEVLILDDNGNSRSWGTLDTLITTPGKTTMDANEVIIFTRGDTIGAGGDNTQITAIAANNAPTATPKVFHYTVPATAADEWPVGNGAAGVVLAAQTSVGTRIGYQEFLVEEIAEEYREHYTSGAGVTVPPTGYAQISSKGTGDGLSVLTVRDIDVEQNEYEPNNSIPGGDRRVQHTAPHPVAVGMAEFSVLVKGATSPSRGDILDDRIDDYFAVGAAVDAGDEPWVIGNAGRFYRTGDLLRAVMIGPRVDGGLTVPVADVWETFRANKEADTGNTRHAIRDAMLSVNDPSPVGTGNDQNVPHAAYYLALFNTIDVNNGDGGLIPGRPNINTMPERLLADILPTVDPAYADGMAAQIVAARETPNGPGGVGRNAGLKGIAYPGQLGFLPSVYTNGSAVPAAQLIDFNEYEPNITHAFNPAPGAAAIADSHSVDTEEQTMMLNYLNQVVSTRSDVYTAYVRVRLYPANDFSANGLGGDGVFAATSEYFLVAVFDRSSVTGQGLPRILSVKRYDVE